jgi:hypothetical protein
MCIRGSATTYFSDLPVLLHIGGDHHERREIGGGGFEEGQPVKVRLKWGGTVSIGEESGV